MILKILIRYILGYVNISIEGYYIERFINVCISKGIFLWNVKIEKSTYATANVGIKDFKKLKEACKKTKCKIKLGVRRGLPFIMNRYRKRKIFFILLTAVIIRLVCRIKICMEYWYKRFRKNTKRRDNGRTFGKWTRSRKSKKQFRNTWNHKQDKIKKRWHCMDEYRLKAEQM